MTKKIDKQNKQKMNGLIDIKKHFATSNCPIYDVVLYSNFKDYPYVGVLYSKIKYHDVMLLLEQGNFKPTPLSEVLFYKRFQEG